MLTMEFKAEVKEEFVFVECNQIDIESQPEPSTSISIEQEHKNEPEEWNSGLLYKAIYCDSAMEVKPEIKKEFDQNDQGYVEPLLLTSIELRELKKEIDEDKPVLICELPEKTIEEKLEQILRKTTISKTENKYHLELVIADARLQKGAMLKT
uniref:Uncharacterized protein LOC114337727 n=1 Tax=Diabrotica virgifera virgifera TaxID=50390 RepID=A0A6P7GB99_DIAVI